MNLQHVYNAISTQKSIAMSFKRVKTQKMFSSQDKKLMETTILKQLY